MRKVVGISASPELLSALDEVVSERRKATMSETITRSSVVPEAVALYIKHRRLGAMVAPINIKGSHDVE
jgi:metal-responsive CopG/Arc/MetJ family transcriptional regulator